MLKLEPRYNKRRASSLVPFETFLGYAYDIDVYANETEDDDHYGTFLIVCDERAARTSYNWDILNIDENGNLINFEKDVDTNMPTLVEIYRLVQQHQEKANA